MENSMLKDLNYFRGLYSRAASYLASEIEKAIDSPENMYRFIYDEYPDKTTLNRIIDQIAENIGIPETELWLKPLIEVLLYQSIVIRRCNEIK